MIKTDVIIIGVGIAALSVANHLCTHGKKVIIITKRDKKSSNSALAQGGISVALSENDSCQSHYEDTMEAGCFENDSEAVMKLVLMAPNVITDFIHSGMRFDSDNCGRLHFGREGAHKLARIIHAGGDRTGEKVIEQLFKSITDDVEIHENEMALDLIVNDGICSGVITRDTNGTLREYTAAYTVIASGGIGCLYPFTSNDITITGDGLAMAYRAGADLKNLEFVQFHPTMLNINGKTMGLVSEAVRGEGGILVNQNGERIMENEHPYKDLAPRDVVSRIVYAHYLKGDEIFLDITPVKNFKERFPSVTEICESNGIDLSQNKIPVRPGAHFHMGGIKADYNGNTNISGLLAVGEAACTGVHGANRLASNSLLEGLVFGRLLADNILAENRLSAEASLELSGIKLQKLPSKQEIQNRMMEFVGIVRHEKKLAEIIEWFEGFAPKSHSFGRISIKNNTNNDFEIYNMLTVGWLISKAAFERKKSLGAHCIE